MLMKLIYDVSPCAAHLHHVSPHSGTRAGKDLLLNMNSSQLKRQIKQCSRLLVHEESARPLATGSLVLVV